MSFNSQFVNSKQDNLVKGKIHTIRQNYEYWKRFEGKEVALFTWEGKPYHSKHKVFCVKRIVSVQKVFFCKPERSGGFYFLFEGQKAYINVINNNNKLLTTNDGFENRDDFFNWFRKGYKEGEMAIIHFTDFRY